MRSGTCTILMGNTSLVLWAAEYGNVENCSAKTLKETQRMLVRPILPVNSDERTPLHVAPAHGHVDVIVLSWSQVGGKRWDGEDRYKFGRR